MLGQGRRLHPQEAGRWMAASLKSKSEACRLFCPMSTVHRHAFQIVGDCFGEVHRLAMTFLNYDFDKYYYRKH